VSAKLLALVMRDLCLVAPRMPRLQELALEIKALNPSCKIRVSTDANDFAGETDVLVTATSAFDQKIVDIMKLKSGAIVCDCSRPLDFSIDDAMKRPDVLIIESGEINLPGAYNLTCDLGLPNKCLYACLGETAVLAMEKRYETFTLGRDLDWQKVKDIYKLSVSHGVQLAGIRGHAGFIHDKEIALVKELVRTKQVSDLSI
jgi:predicted amino acid dehydrogenase